MSFYVHGHHGLKTKSLQHALKLAESGQIPHANVMWQKHKEVHDKCICESKLFDQVRCGFCFASTLRAMELLEGSQSHIPALNQTAENVTAYVRRKIRSQLHGEAN